MIDNDDTVLNTVNPETVYESLAKLCSTSTFEIKTRIKQNYNEINDYYLEGKIWKLHLHAFLPDNVIVENLRFSHVVINHIASYPNIQRVRNEGIFPLQYALTKPTTLSEHLNSFNIEFEYDSEHNIIIMKKDGQVYTSRNESVRYLPYRLTGINNCRDFGINGFLWSDKYVIYKVGGYLGAPEFLKMLSNEFDNPEIITSYYDDNNEMEHNYLISLKIPIENISFETEDNNCHKNSYEKTEFLIKYSLAYLSSQFDKSIDFSYENNIMLVNDHYCVPPKDIIMIRKLRIQNYYVYPIDMNT